MSLLLPIRLSGQWGDAGRDIVTGPTVFGLNASASRTIRVGERKNLDIRFDSVNLLNHKTLLRAIT